MKRKRKADPHDEDEGQDPRTGSTSVCLTTSVPLILILVLTCATLSSSHVIQTSHVFQRNQSPYLINDHIEVIRNGQLRIEPGVELRFAPGTGITVRSGGSLVAAVSKFLIISHNNYY
jgi:hypothetical protein